MLSRMTTLTEEQIMLVVNGDDLSGYARNPLLDRLSDRVEFTDNEFNVMAFKDLQAICREGYAKGSKMYRQFSKNKLIQLMHNDPRWNLKLNDCRMMISPFDRVCNCIIRIRRK